MSGRPPTFGGLWHTRSWGSLANLFWKGQATEDNCTLLLLKRCCGEDKLHRGRWRTRGKSYKLQQGKLWLTYGNSSQRSTGTGTRQGPIFGDFRIWGNKVPLRTLTWSDFQAVSALSVGAGLDDMHRTLPDLSRPFYSTWIWKETETTYTLLRNKLKRQRNLWNKRQQPF